MALLHWIGITLLIIASVIATTNVICLFVNSLKRHRGVNGWISPIPLVGSLLALLGLMLTDGSFQWLAVVVLAVDPGGIIWLAVALVILRFSRSGRYAA